MQVGDPVPDSIVWIISRYHINSCDATHNFFVFDCETTRRNGPYHRLVIEVLFEVQWAAF